MPATNVAIIGVGNCASSFAQAVAVADDHDRPGLIHPVLAGQRVSDLRITAAFDIDARKVGTPLHAALAAEPNCTTRYVPVPTAIMVHCGPLADGIGAPAVGTIEVAPQAATVSVADVARVLAEQDVQVVVNFLPVGSAEAARRYAEAALRAGAAFVNCTPERFARSADWHTRFQQAGLPLLGDDLKSQLGATTVHRALLELCHAKAARITRTYQLNVGGNTDFLNMTDRTRASSKRDSKVGALSSLLDDGVSVDAGPSDYIASLADTKVAHLRIEGELLLGMPFSVEVRLQVEDSPNAAGVVVDAVRLARAALDRRIGGAVVDVCPYLFKAPPRPCPDAVAERRLRAFADGSPHPAG